MSGQMMAQERHAVHRPGSKHSAKGKPCRLKLSDIRRILSGHAETHNWQPLHFSVSNSGLPRAGMA